MYNNSSPGVTTTGTSPGVLAGSAEDVPLTSFAEEGMDDDYDDVGEDEEDEDDVLLPDISEVEHLRVVLRLTSFKEETENLTVPVCYYYIHVCAETLGGKVWFVKKRYSQFDALRKSLTRVVRHPPELPGKDVLRRMLGIQSLRKRANGLSTFLWRVAADPLLCDSKPLRHFLFTDVVRAPPANVHTTTPLITSSTFRPQHSDSLAASRFSLDPAPIGSTRTHGSYRELSASSPTRGGSGSGGGVGGDWADDNASDDGRLFLGVGSTADDIQRGFANEGLSFAEADVIGGSHLSESDAFQAATSCSIFPSFIRRRQDRELPPTMAAPPPLVLTTQESNSSTASVASADDSTVSQVPDPFPPLRVVIILVGSRGDVQPYVALGKALKAKGHSVRVAAHGCFREWIEVKHGLEFAPIAGDPKELLKMVVENKMFSYNFVKNGLTNHRAWVSQVLLDCWNACTQEDPFNVKPALRKNSHLVGPGHAFTALESKYRADLIIANPPSFAGWHISEALGVPLLMSFPMPWSRTTEFPSPFTSLSALSSPASMNWMSYGAVDRLIWLGLGDLINAFRVQTLLLAPIWTLSAKGHRYIHDYRVPFLYCWSPSVLKQPNDWADHILVSGYLFLDDSDGSDWQPDATLKACFDETDPRPVVFIGFGSIVVKDPERLSDLILGAASVLVEKGYKVLVQKGWAGVDLDTSRLPGVYLIGAAPHSWIFARCAVVVHHGGSGTTAEGLRLGVPTVVVPFFGDQFFWGETVLRKGLGDYEPYTSLTPLRLVECILNSAQPPVKERCLKVSQGIKREDGARRAVDFIERQIMSFDGFSAIVQDEDWRRYPYYDLKKRIKTQRYENVKGFRKVKSRVKKLGSLLTSSSSSTDLRTLKKHDSAMGTNGVEMHCVTPVKSSATATKRISSLNAGDFPFMPQIFPGKVPEGHTPFSWFGELPTALTSLSGGEDKRDLPMGHTAFSWTAASW